MIFLVVGYKQRVRSISLLAKYKLFLLSSKVKIKQTTKEYAGYNKLDNTCEMVCSMITFPYHSFTLINRNITVALSIEFSKVKWIE